MYGEPVADCEFPYFESMARGGVGSFFWALIVALAIIAALYYASQVSWA